ncbi:MAG: nucleoside monophosphate kinase [Parcubacteria group bacterium]
MQKHVILFYGPPGAGKGTQAGIIAKKYGLTHFDTGKHIEKLVNDTSLLKKNAILRRQRKLFMSGKLADSNWAGAEVKKQIKKFYVKGKGLVMSGSPRTMREAFNLKGGGVADTLIRRYGLKNILVVFLRIPVSESVKRNSKRGRTGLDEPSVIRVRCRVYQRETLPVVRELKKRGIKVAGIDGTPSVKTVERAVEKEVKKFFEADN